MRKLLLSFITVLALLFSSRIYAFDLQPFENSWIHDYANVISPTTETSINEIADALDENGYAQLVMVVVDFLDGQDVEDYAYSLFNTWKIGHSDDNDGVLVLVSVGDREYYLLQGKGLEKILKSSDLGDIADEVLIPELINDDYDNGLLLTANAISSHLSNYYQYNQPGNPGESVSGVSNTSKMIAYFIMQLIFAIILLIILVYLIRIFSRSPRYYRRTRHYHPTYQPRPTHTHYHNTPSRSYTHHSSSSRSSSFSGSSSSRSHSSRSMGGGSSRGGGRGGKF